MYNIIFIYHVQYVCAMAEKRSARTLQRSGGSDKIQMRIQML